MHSTRSGQLARAVPSVLGDPVRTVLSQQKMVPLRVVSSDGKEIDCNQGGLDSATDR